MKKKAAKTLKVTHCNGQADGKAQASATVQLLCSYLSFC